MKKNDVNQRPLRMAICYDFDKTLSPDDMQTFTLIPSFGIDVKTFWEESDSLAKENLMDKNLAWMQQLIRYSQFKGRSLKKEYFRNAGAKVPLYNGLDQWFERLNKAAAEKGILLEHYVISSGLKETIEGSPIAKFFKRIYASAYLYSADGTAIWPAQAVNYTNKTQFLFRIAKGIFEEYDEGINETMADKDLYLPYENMVYIGDSATDIPCMKLVKSRGGYSIGVYDPQKNDPTRVHQLFKDGRINYFAPADYRENSDMDRYLIKVINEVAAKEIVKTEQLLAEEKINEI